MLIFRCLIKATDHGDGDDDIQCKLTILGQNTGTLVGTKYWGKILGLNIGTKTGTLVGTKYWGKIIGPKNGTKYWDIVGTLVLGH